MVSGTMGARSFASSVMVNQKGMAKSMDSLTLAKTAAGILDAKKADQINVIRISDVSSLGDYFVLAEPQAIQIIKTARFRGEDVYDHRFVIEHDPGIGAIALHAVRRNTELFQLKLQFVRQSMHMRVPLGSAQFL